MLVPDGKGYYITNLGAIAAARDLEQFESLKRKRFKLTDKQRNSITNLIADTLRAGRIKRKDENSGNKFVEYLPYWA